MSSEHQKETAFLRRCILYEEGEEGRQLDERIAQLQRDQRSLRRMTWLMALLAGLVLTGFGYAVFLSEDFPNHISEFAAALISKMVCALGIGSLASLLALSFLGMLNHRELNLRRAECRQLVTTLLERRVGKLPAPHQNGELKEPELIRVPQQTGHAQNGEHKPATSAIVRTDFTGD